MRLGRVHPTHGSPLALLPLVGALSTAAALIWVRWRPRRLVVDGPSMAPTLLPGDRLLALRTHRLSPGDVVAVRDPRRSDRVLVKRVAAVGDHGVTVLGDNPAASTDSRQFGQVDRSAVVGTVRRRYAPPDRAGPLPPRR